LSLFFSHLTGTLNPCTAVAHGLQIKRRIDVHGSLCISLGASWTTVWGMLCWALSSSSCCLNHTGTYTPEISISCTMGFASAHAHHFLGQSCPNGS
jgi:hypothetical protein